MQGHKRKSYSLAYKIQAVERYLDNGENLQATAVELDVHPATMKHWVQKGIDGLREQLVNPVTSKEVEIKKLKKELGRLSEENEILKKAARMFAAQA
ncbi:transposase [Endozoicomonas ascidiicola]|uniref:transposase n=1 Tax=Endozoicomonas ascidiicola TaxID=1698521 RepID=UPI00082ECAF9|nr:transposase [Endozoicomonas ascidiicola]